VPVGKTHISDSRKESRFFVYGGTMNPFLLLAVIAWGFGALEAVLGISSKVNWLCAGLCLAGIGVWF
jgi:hypothetical protein